jgi:hypothetical protein
MLIWITAGINTKNDTYDVPLKNVKIVKMVNLGE